MRWSIRIARAAGIDVKLHLTFLLLPLIYGLHAYLVSGGSWSAVVETLTLLALVFGSVLLHEFGHALAARHYDIQTVDITLLPIGGVARLERMPEEPAQEIAVALAGPLVNVVIIFGLGLTLSWEDVRWAFFGNWDDMPNTYAPLILLAINAKLLLFNLIPAFPMDGGRVLRASLAWVMGYARATRAAAGVGQLFAVLFVVAGIGMFPPWFTTWNLVLVLIAFFIYVAGSREAKAAQARQFTHGIELRDAMITEFRTLPRTATLADAIALLLHTMQRDFPIVDDQGQVQGILSRQDIVAGVNRSGSASLVMEAMQDTFTVAADAPFEEALAKLQSSDAALPVVDPHGKPIGLLTADGVSEMMDLQEALAKGGRAAWPAPSWLRPTREEAPPPLPARQADLLGLWL